MFSVLQISQWRCVLYGLVVVCGSFLAWLLLDSGLQFVWERMGSVESRALEVSGANGRSQCV